MVTTKNIEFWRKFINLYRKLPAVWKIKCDDYKNRDLKSECYVKLTDKLSKLLPFFRKIWKYNYNRAIDLVGGICFYLEPMKNYQTTVMYF